MEPAPAEQQSPRRLRRFYEALALAYGPQHWWPSESQLETIIGAYLTQNTSWRNVVRSIANLKAAGALTLPGLRALDDEQLRTLIRPSGYMVRKGAAIRAFLVLLDEHYSGSFAEMAAAPVEETREHLLALPGVGPETADAILLYALDQPVMVVDEYLRRVVTRHGLLDERARYAGVQQTRPSPRLLKTVERTCYSITTSFTPSLSRWARRTVAACHAAAAALSTALSLHRRWWKRKLRAPLRAKW